MIFDLTISIVLYRSNKEKLQKVFSSISHCTLNYKLYLIDNSPTDELKSIAPSNAEYIFNDSNLGFGKAHNIALRRAVQESKYHLVLNPDVYFDSGTLEKLFARIESQPDVGMISPKVLYPDGETQYLCKLLPTPMDLIGRRFLRGVSKAVVKQNELYELRASGYNKEMNIPFLSGCFMFIRTEVLKKVGFFDEKIFMYCEDADLTRRIHQKYITLFYPSATIHHYYGQGSYKNFRLMLYNMHGAIVYFTKWGWLFDKERDEINKRTVQQYMP